MKTRSFSTYHDAQRWRMQQWRPIGYLLTPPGRDGKYKVIGPFGAVS